MSGAGKGQELLRVTSEQRGNAVHLYLFGEIDITTTPVLEGCLLAAEGDGNAAIVVDLDQVTFIDASGLRAFLGASRRAIRSGRTFEIARAPALVVRVLRITGATHLLAANSLARWEPHQAVLIPSPPTVVSSVRRDRNPAPTTA